MYTSNNILILVYLLRDRYYLALSARADDPGGNTNGHTISRPRLTLDRVSGGGTDASAISARVAVRRSLRAVTALLTTDFDSYALLSRLYVANGFR